MELPIFLVDAFASTSFSGNPAAVVLLEQNLAEEKLSDIAAEMNQAETTYIRCLAANDTFQKADRFGLRWFTPRVEVNLCGHATLAAAAVLFSQCHNQNETITFETLSGDLCVRHIEDRITLDFPLNPPEQPLPESTDCLVQVVEAACGMKVKDVAFSSTTGKLFVRLPDSVSRAELERLPMQPEALQRAQPTGPVRGVIVSLLAASDGGEENYDYFSRYFAPWVGIPEDSVTGSAHTVSGAYWGRVLGKRQLKARQCSSRGGDVYISLREGGRVELSGRAAIVLHGHLRL